MAIVGLTFQDIWMPLNLFKLCFVRVSQNVNARLERPPYQPMDGKMEIFGGQIRNVYL